MSFIDTLTLKVTISPDIINPFLKSVLITSEKTFNSFVKLWVSISLTEKKLTFKTSLKNQYCVKTHYTLCKLYKPLPFIYFFLVSQPSFEFLSDTLVLLAQLE